MSEIKVTDHAIKRWVSRVKPAFTRHQAKQELEALVSSDLVERKTAEELGLSNKSEEYLVLSEGIYAPILTLDNGEEGIASILIRGGLSARERQYRNRKRKDRRHRKQYKEKNRSPGRPSPDDNLTGE